MAIGIGSVEPAYGCTPFSRHVWSTTQRMRVETGVSRQGIEPVEPAHGRTCRPFQGAFGSCRGFHPDVTEYTVRIDDESITEARRRPNGHLDQWAPGPVSERQFWEACSCAVLRCTFPWRARYTLITTPNTMTILCSKLFLSLEQNNFRSCCPQGLRVNYMFSEHCSKSKDNPYGK